MGFGCSLLLWTPFTPSAGATDGFLVEKSSVEPLLITSEGLFVGSFESFEPRSILCTIQSFSKSVLLNLFSLLLLS